MELREAILIGELKPGDQVLQEEFAARLGVSRVPVREALKMLEGEGLVTYSPHHGYMVTKLSIAEITEIYRIRDLLEDEAVRLGVPLLDEGDIEQMERLTEQLERAYLNDDILEILWANREFHSTIFNRGCTIRLQKLIRVVWDSIEPYRSHYFADTEHHAEQSKDHSEIIAAARDHDTERVLRLNQTHRARALSSILHYLSEEGEEGVTQA